ncbi:MAG TPA: FKBP-type peptidyl-prolyl cis-trans isomerase [Solirubrobacterales bacterium]
MDRRLIGLLAFGAALAVVVIAVLIGRGGDDDGGGSTTADAGSKPTVEVPEGPPPTELQIEDLEVGDGPEAATGDQVSVQYVGVDYESGEEFDSSWDRGEPFRFQLGAGEVIPGWDEGVVGMKVGGRRELLIPPDLAYGAQGQPPDIGPNATLIFVIDLVSVGS